MCLHVRIDIHVHTHEHIRTDIVHPFNCPVCNTVFEIIIRSEGESNRRFLPARGTAQPYNYFAFVCLFVCLSVLGLGRPGNELMAAAGTYGCFELAGLFASSLQKEAKQCQYC